VVDAKIDVKEKKFADEDFQDLDEVWFAWR
jgi:hypothetical protein